MRSITIKERVGEARRGKNDENVKNYENKSFELFDRKKKNSFE